MSLEICASSGSSSFGENSNSSPSAGITRCVFGADPVTRLIHSFLSPTERHIRRILVIASSLLMSSWLAQIIDPLARVCCDAFRKIATVRLVGRGADLTRLIN